MAETLEQLILKPELPAYIQLFEIDCTNIPEINNIYYFTSMVDGNNLKVNFGNQDYDPFPIDISGIEQSSEGAPARPIISLSNITKLFGALSFLHEDLVGCKVTYIRTFSIYLNAAARISAPPLQYTIAKKIDHDEEMILWELRSPTDKEKSYIPGRQMLKTEFPGLGINKHIR